MSSKGAKRLSRRCGLVLLTTLLLSLFSLMSVAYAQASPPPDPTEETTETEEEGAGDFFDDQSLLDKLTPDAVQWFERTINYVEGKRGEALSEMPSYGLVGGTGPNLFKLFINLGWTIVFALFIYGLVNAIYFYRSDDHWQLFGRLFIAAALLWGSPAVGKSLATNWVGFHDFTQRAFAQSTNDRMFSALEIMADEAPAFLLAMVALDKVEALATGGPGALLKDTAGEVNPGRQIQRLAWLFRATVIVILIMYGLHVLSIYSTGLVVVLGMLLLPIVSSLILLPGMGSYLSRWLSMILTAFTALLLSVIIYAVAMDLAFIIPLNNLSEQLIVAEAAADEAFAAIFPNFSSISGNPLDWFGDLLGYFGGVYEAIDGAVGQTSRTVALYIFNVIFIVIGMFMGLYLLMNYEQFIAGFLSGSVASGAQSLAFGMAAAVGIGAAARARASDGGEGGGSVVNRGSIPEIPSGSPSLMGTGRQLALPAPSKELGKAAKVVAKNPEILL